MTMIRTLAGALVILLLAGAVTVDGKRVDKPGVLVAPGADLRVTAVEAVKRFKSDVEAGRFPSEGESYR